MLTALISEAFHPLCSSYSYSPFREQSCSWTVSSIRRQMQFRAHHKVFFIGKANTWTPHIQSQIASSNNFSFTRVINLAFLPKPPIPRSGKKKNYLSPFLFQRNSLCELSRSHPFSPQFLHVLGLQYWRGMRNEGMRCFVHPLWIHADQQEVYSRYLPI